MSQRKPDKRKQPEPSQIMGNAAQRGLKNQRKRNGKMYTSTAGIKGQIASDPYKGKVSFGTDKYRFEEVLEVDPEGFQINDQLEPRLWKDEKLRPFISKKLMEIANDFIDGLPFNVTIQDVRFTGSLANYNWSKYSDIDLHIVVDFEELDDNKELVKEMFDAKRLRWNEHHDITIKGYEVELYVEDEGEEHSSSGVYSVMEDEWVNHPEASIDAMYDRGQFEKVIRHVDRLKKKIRSMRQAGLDTEAMEFSPENIAFKLLRRNDLLDTLTKLKYKAYDQSMTLDD
jgi:hypothetical protein